ncbi:MAG: ArsR family transcriptional regulator [Methanoregulaceae archaeon]
MKSKIVEYFTRREEDLALVLTELGLKRNIAKVLVYLMNTAGHDTTSRDIERGADLRQPEVCLALGYLVEKKWLSCEEQKTECKGRPVKIYRLMVQPGDIIDEIEVTKKKEIKETLTRIEKLRTCIS